MKRAGYVNNEGWEHHQMVKNVAIELIRQGATHVAVDCRDLISRGRNQMVPDVMAAFPDGKRIAVECGGISSGVVQRLNTLAESFEEVLHFPYTERWYVGVAQGH